MAFQKKKEVTTEDFAVGQPKDISLEGINLVGGQSIEAAEGEVQKEYLRELAFMDELIEVVVAESTDENAENPIQVGVNGVFVLLTRGQPTRVKRKFVDALIVKSSKISTPEFINNGGERARAIRQTSALKFPFSIIEDKNPRGVDWLRRRMGDLV